MLRTSLPARSLFPLLLICGALFAASAPAQQPLPAVQPLQTFQTLLVDVDHRPAISLDGPWHYLVDMPGVALYDGQGKVRDTTYALNRHPNLVGEHKGEEYDFSTAPTLNVPGDWNTQDPTLFRYEGVVWYERDFSFDPKPHTRTFLHIGAANYRSHIWINGKRLCDHEGGFTPFDCEATQVLKPGSNFVVIAVDATRLVDGIPSVDVDWYNYGGLTRDVSLVEVPEQFIDDYEMHLEKSRDRLSGYVHIEGATAGVPVTLRIPEAKLETTATTDADGRAAFTLPASNLTLWSPENPKLYKIQIAAGLNGSGSDESGADMLADEIGFRTIEVSGTEILLNGKPIFLRGICAQAEAPYRTGRVSTDKDVEAIFGFLHDLHANFVRLAHYPHDERMTRMADRQGILVWSEIPLWQRIAFDRPGVYDKAQTMLREMIRRDRNKASVILWSVANETGNFPARNDFLDKLIAEARTLDPTRPITAALNSQHIEGTAASVSDPLTNVLDVVGINEYIGWYTGLPVLADSITWTVPDKPLIMSEFGAEAKAGNHGPEDQRWTEESQANLYRHQLGMLNKIPQLRGIAPWILMDFRSPVRNIPHLQDGFNRKGLISEDGKKKQAFSVLQQAYEQNSIGKAQ